jgi:hydroxymethylpyrimidine pyrophosphatase-like HAD family hydrolase
MAIKLVLCDMDGTLVPFGHDGVSDRTIRAIHELVESGIHFGPSSGRERGDLVRFFYGDELCLGTGIMGGGKMVYVDGKLVYRRTLPYDALLDMVSELLLIDGAVFNFYLPTDEHGRGPAGFGAAGVTPQQLRVISEHLGEGFSFGLFPEPPEGVTTGAILFDEQQVTGPEVIARLSAACPGIDFVRSAPYAYDVLEKGWSKVNALPIIQESLGVGLDEIAYFGDSHNDLTMMEAIPNSFCPANGVPEVKAVARYVIGDCEDDSVAEVLEFLALHSGRIAL